MWSAAFFMNIKLKGNQNAHKIYTTEFIAAFESGGGRVQTRRRRIEDSGFSTDSRQSLLLRVVRRLGARPEIRLPSLRLAYYGWGKRSD
jgi:hypothetical protein